MDKKEDAKIFQNIRTAEQWQTQMKGGCIQRMRDSAVGRAVGAAYDSPLAKGIVGGLRDAYRRIFEQGWFQGRDVFDGRWNFDNQVGQKNSGWPQSIQGMARAYDQRASFYGLDQKQDQSNGQDRQQGQEYSRER